MRPFVRHFLCIHITLFIICSVASGGIEDSHHDFSWAGWGDDEICKPCHIPHNADTSVADAPLWNHEVTSSVFQPYTSPTLDATPNQPGSHSKLCLSCHDGSVALDSFGGNTGTHFLNSNDFGFLGTDFEKHHPISITYDTGLSLQDGELFDPATASSGLGGTISDDLLFNDRLECSSCHDVHVSRNDAGCTGCHFGPNTETLSLRVSNEASAFCMTCHDK